MAAMLGPRPRASLVRQVGIALARGGANATATSAQPRPKRRGRRLPDMTRSNPARLSGLTVVLPCFNEAPNIAQAISEASAAAARNADEHQIVVVDDGSTDGTADIADAMAHRLGGVTVVRHDVNRGYGAALASGVRAARMPWVLLTDADLQFDAGQIERFVPLAADADVVLGWRIDRQDPLHRRMNAAAWNWLVGRAFDLRVRDVDCAFKLIRAGVLDGIALTSSGAMISTELIVRARAAGARVREVGVDHRPRVAGEQSGANPRVVLRAFRELHRLRLELRTTAARPATGAPATA
jgi:glycosyltransferase involved in cell wall biosynthesis